jgi:protoporphyrinogen oxidase
MQRAVGEKVYRLLWQPLLRAKFHDNANTISMAWLWSRIATRARSRRSPFSRELLGYLRGGCCQIIPALEKKLREGGATIALNTPVRHLKISKDNKGIEIVTEGAVIRADRVISTLPSPLFASTIEHIPGVSQQYLDSLRSISYLGAICIVLELNQSLSPFYWTNICMDAAPFVALIEHTNLVGTESYGGKHIYYLGAYVPHDHPYFCESTDFVENAFIAFLERIFPKFHRKMITNVRTFRFQNAQHVVDTHYADRMPSHRTPIQNVFLANFSQSFPEDRGINTAIRLANKVVAIASENNRS